MPLFLLSSSSVPLCNLLYYSSVFFFKKNSLLPCTLSLSPLYSLPFSLMCSLCFVFSFSLLFRFLYSPSPLFSSPCVAQFFPFSALFRFLHFPSPCFFFVYPVLFRPPRVLLFSFLSFSSLCFLFLTFPSPFVFFSFFSHYFLSSAPSPPFLLLLCLVLFLSFYSQNCMRFFYLMKTFGTIIAVVTVER
jgi:hypothetical protein